MYEEAQKVGDLKEAMDKARNYGIVTEEQRGIWTTWRISMNKLDDSTLHVDIRKGTNYRNIDESLC